MVGVLPLTGVAGRAAALAVSQLTQDAVAAYQRGATAEAERLCRLALDAKPDYFDALYVAGIIAEQTGRPQEAVELLSKAIAVNPGMADAHYNRGVALGAIGRAAEALESYERAIALRPDYADAYFNRGVALAELDRHTEAVDSYERAIALAPDHSSAHWNLADCRLLLGDFALGWQEYEWRWKLAQNDNGLREFEQPLWLGAQTLKGRTILLHSELGVGDTFHFCRYAKEVAALGANVVLEVQPSVLSLLADLDGVAQVVPRGAPLPAFDYHCPLMTMPLAFKTDLASIPADIPYVRSDPARVAAWREKLGNKRKPRVGLVWSGSMLLKNDKRSMVLAEMLPLVADWAEWVCLQKEVGESEIGLLASRPDVRFVGGELKDFADTAALLDLMDIVVSVDTGVAHLAGAMGKPVWILLPFIPIDWRWMLDREDSVWYPTARLFRQSANRDWAGVIGRVKEELARHFDVRS